MAVFYVQAAFMLKSWPTHNRKKLQLQRHAAATHLFAALIIFYDGPCAIKYVHRGTTAGRWEAFYLYKFTYAVTVDAGRETTHTHGHAWHCINTVFVSGNF